MRRPDVVVRSTARFARHARRPSARPSPPARRVANAIDTPGAALALERLAQRQVRLEGVERSQRRRLVYDVVGRGAGEHAPKVSHRAQPGDSLAPCPGPFWRPQSPPSRSCSRPPPSRPRACPSACLGDVSASSAILWAKGTKREVHAVRRAGQALADKNAGLRPAGDVGKDLHRAAKGHGSQAPRRAIAPVPGSTGGQHRGS